MSGEHIKMSENVSIDWNYVLGVFIHPLLLVYRLHTQMHTHTHVRCRHTLADNNNDTPIYMQTYTQTHNRKHQEIRNGLFYFFSCL